MSSEDGGSHSEHDAVSEKSQKTDEKTNGETTRNNKKRPATQVETLLTWCFAYIYIPY